MYYEAQEELHIAEQNYIDTMREAQQLHEDDMRAEGEIMEYEERNQ